MTDLLPDLLLLFHLLCVIVWLGCDFVVFFLSLSLINRQLPAVVRADRAHVAEVIDRYVLYSYLLTMPVGLGLAYWRGWWPIWAMPWLMLKLVVFGVIILLAIVLVTGAAGAGLTLKQIAAGAGDIEALEAKLRKGVIGLAPWAAAIHLAILVAVFIAITPRGKW
ncbi:MAG: hypothetical protein HYR56_06270 [Acidobacteria bacterium]|nr:hypothetical protein [Acidobacteriota bacterium]MBI3427405.1 hypothetical protein [Acidobacteriota bacterium]